MAASLCSLGSALSFEVARSSLASLPELLATSRSLRAHLLAAAARQRPLRVDAEDVTPELAAALCRVPGLAALEVGGREFVLEQLRTTPRLAAPLSAAEALLLAPVLRANGSLRWVRSAHAWLDVERVRALTASPGAVQRWRALVAPAEPPDGAEAARPCSAAWADMPSCDAECVLLAGLLRRAPPRSGACARRDAQDRRPALAVDLVIASRGAAGLLRGAAGRSRLRLAGPWEPGARPGPPGPRCCPAAPWLWLAACAAPVVLLREREHAYARQEGFPGALSPQHPLKALTFAERAALLADRGALEAAGGFQLL